MSYILVFFSIVGVGGTNASVVREYDWRPIGEFKSLSACQQASKALGIGKRAVCLPTDSIQPSAGK